MHVVQAIKRVWGGVEVFDSYWKGAGQYNNDNYLSFRPNNYNV